MKTFGHPTFVQAGDRIEDGVFVHLKKRFLINLMQDSDEDIEEKANKLWLDVRSFEVKVFYLLKNQVVFVDRVSINMAKSLEPIVISSLQITRSTNGMEAKNESGRSSDTMGMKYFLLITEFDLLMDLVIQILLKNWISTEDVEE